MRQLKAQAELGADLGLGPYWTERLVELDTSSWNATASSATFSLAPDVVRGLLDPRVGAPLPIPSFDEFCALSYAVTYVAEINESFRALYKASTTLGIRALGNAINLGKLAFAPDTAGVRGLVERLNATHRFFDAHFAGIFASEDAALAALNADGNEDLWAVVALRDEGDGAETLYSSEGSSEGSSGGFARGGGRGCGVGSPVLCATAAIRMRSRRCLGRSPVRPVEPDQRRVPQVLHERVPDPAVRDRRGAPEDASGRGARRGGGGGGGGGGDDFFVVVVVVGADFFVVVVVGALRRV